MLTRLEAAPPRLPTTRVLCIDGPSGSGKSELATRVGAARPGSVVVRLDDLLHGWGGLPDLAATVAQDLLAPLARGERASYRRYDWHAGVLAERVHLPATDLLVLDGVGSGARLIAPWRSLLVWVEAERDVRRARGLSRDGDSFAPHWATWARQEAAHHEAQRTRESADVLRDTSHLPFA